MVGAIHLLKSILERGIVHNNISPSNLVFGYDQTEKQIQLIDFGNAYIYREYFDSEALALHCILERADQEFNDFDDKKK